ncbi:hypothetical protein [Pantoea ananatis]|uniref:hypothetical protein n=1 Tax=Pantoea ananas TaxID=553 RepID=UPI000DA6D43D|nr:hypothetical protein [Pantoea ananatis]PZD68442.1 hypothetical protein ARC272_00860 [Pantoea ananatis]
MRFFYFLTSVFFLQFSSCPVKALLHENAPFPIFVGDTQKLPGTQVEFHIGRATTNIVPHEPHYVTANAGIAIYFYWCTQTGGSCAGPANTRVPPENIIARGDGCPTNDIHQFIDCLHEKIDPGGQYMATVPDNVGSDSRLTRGQVCLRYLSDVNSALGTTFTTSYNSCKLSPPTQTWCAMETPNVDIDFGIVHVGEAEGQRREKDISVYCSGPANYIIDPTSADSSVPLSNGMKAELTIDGQLIQSQRLVSTEEGSTAYKLQAELKGQPVAGAFNSTAVLFISYP